MSSENTDAAQDAAFLDSPDPVITKTQATGITESGNAAANRATIGEIIRYEVTATIPDGTRVYDGVITDTLPTGIVWHDGPGLFGGAVSTLSPTATSTTGSAALAGNAVTHSGGVVTYTLPTPYTNASGSGDDQVTITFYGRVTDVPGNIASPATRLRNRAQFNWRDAAGVANPQLQSGVVDSYVVEPNPQIAKTHTSPVGLNASPGATVTYQVAVSNPFGPTNVSPAHDLTVVDTVPAGMTPLGAGSVPVTSNGDLVPSTGVSPAGSFDGVWSQTNRTITWVPTAWTAGLNRLDPGATSTFTYAVAVDEPAVSSSSLTNTASLTAYTLDQDLTPTLDPNAANARSYARSDTDTIAVPLASIVKDIEPFNDLDPTDDRPNANVGEPVDYEVTMTLPANTIAYDTTLFDELPSRLDFDSFNSITASASCEVLNSGTGLTTGVSLNTGDVETFNDVGGVTGRTAWFLGDLYANTDCEITVGYTAHVNDSAVAGDSITNDAVLLWNGSEQIGQSPASMPVGYDDPNSVSWDVTSSADSETFTVIEPGIRIDKDVANTDGSPLANPACDITPGNVGDGDGTGANGCDTEAGTTLRYDVTITATGTSPSHDITVVDTVPVGLQPLDAPAGSPVTTTGGTVLGSSGSTGVWNDTSRTITWTVAGPLSTAATAAFDYDATVAASDDLDRGEDLTNVAGVSTYYAFSSADRAQIVLDNRRTTTSSPTATTPAPPAVASPSMP
ncbi:MAG: isopeptide-forming domain-containing fimbrial protein [Acidimicrobiales bacterium]